MWATVTCPGWSKISVFMHTLNEDDWEEFKPEGSSKTVSELKLVRVPGSFGPPKVQVAKAEHCQWEDKVGIQWLRKFKEATQ